MSLTLLVSDNPFRQLAFRPPSNKGNTNLIISGSAGPTFTTGPLPGFQMLAPRPIYGCIGIVSVNKDLFVGVITEASRVADIEGHYIYVVAKVNFHCITSSRYESLLESSQGNTEQEQIHPLAGVSKLLSSGSFYFCKTLDLSRDLRQRKSDSVYPGDIESSNPVYLWNNQILTEVLEAKRDLDAATQQEINQTGLLVSIIQGFVGCETVAISSARWRIGIISRLSSNRAGTRFNARGIDDDGYVSNFVETEFLIYTDHATVSFLQIRGSVPLFWEQTGVQVSHKVKLSRGPESTRHATVKHFDELTRKYSKVQIVNLLSQNSVSPEFALNELYKNMVLSLSEFSRSLKYYNFDFHAIVQRDKYERLERLAKDLADPIREFGFNVYDSNLDIVIQRQYGVMRTNCLDCLDRTNVVQTLLAKKVLQLWVDQMGITIPGYDQENLETVFNNLWADNGDWLSKIYAGTGALKSSYTRNGKQTVFGFLDDAAKSVNRFYVQNFQDKGRQEAIELLLREREIFLSSRNNLVRKDLAAVSYSGLQVFCGTFNLNGKLPGESLNSWLVSQQIGLSDIVVIGCQELIKLDPKEYITADTEKLRLVWESALLSSLNEIPGSDYVILRSIHLVAIGLFVYVRNGTTARIRQVEVSSIKTGLMGMAANKGGIGIRMRVDDTSIAFVTAHFAAGQSAVEDRNRDYWTINDGLNFRGNRLGSTDHVFWFGDFNYRVDAENGFTRPKITQRNYQELWLYDQLLLAKKQNLAFPEFQEGKLNFDPTYKYDNGSTIYDTSEKQRVPAWTDRVLYKGKDINLIEYARGEQMMSDHRPVRAIFLVPIASNDKKNGSRRNLEPVSSLPLPSSNELKWWQNYPPKSAPIVSGSNPFFDAIPTGILFGTAKTTVNLMD